MRFIIYMVLMGMLSVSASTYSQNTKLTLYLENTTLKQLLSDIQEQSEFCFLYNVDNVDLNRKVSVKKKNETIETILDEALKETGLKYQVFKKQVVLFPDIQEGEKEESASEITQKGIKIHGVVLAEDNTPLPGVTIVEEGTTNGTTTDSDGVYVIEVFGSDAFLIYTFIGYKGEKIEVRKKRVINVVLTPDVSELEEVVVVGFGHQKRASVIGSMSTVSVDKLQSSTRSITNSLAGQLAGIIAVQRSGEPGKDEADFWIRGISTFMGKTKPLVLIDGVERSIGNIDPEEIESFSILKDATATAVYGVRGANGVILINTKQGKSGPVRIKLRSEMGFSQPTQKPDFVDGATFMDLYNEALIATGMPTSFSSEYIAATRSGNDPDLYPSVNWLDAVTRNTAKSQRYNLTVSGGSTKIRYHLTGSYYNETGILKEDPLVEYGTNIDLKRYNFRSDITADITKTTRIRLNIGGFLIDKIVPGNEIDYILDNALRVSPITFPHQYSDGTLAMTIASGTNPYTLATQTGYKQKWNNQIQTMFNIEQKLDFFTKGLRGNAKFSFDTWNYSSINRTREPAQFFATGRDDDGNLEFIQTVDGQPFLGFSKSLTGSRAIYFESSLIYNRNFGDNRVGGLLLYNQREFLNASAGSAISSLPYRNQGFAGRLTYSYDDRYFGELNFGYNGSENFAIGNRFGFFPSVAVGWVISNEKFMKNKKKVVNKLKIRASHGLVGNDEIGGNRFAYLTTINTGAKGYQYGVSGNYYNWGGNAEGKFGDPFLTWETVAKSNLGIEIGLFNKLDIQADYFYDYRTDIFIQRNSLPGTSGYISTPWANYGKMSNQGVDGSLTFYHSFSKELSFSMRGNFTYAHNKIEEMDEPERLFDYQMRTGKIQGQQFGLIAEGLFTYDDFDEFGTLIPEISEHTFGPVRPGDIRYKDVNNDGRVDAYDEMAIGKAKMPEITYGFGVTMRYKGFDIGLFAQGIGNTSIILGGQDFFPFNNGVRGNIYSTIEKRWTEENPSQDVLWPRLYAGTNGNNYRASTWWQRDASFIRLKNAEIGYQLPKELLQKVRIQSLRLFARGTNLFTWSKEIKMWDPEIGTNDGMVYPPSMLFTFGMEINL